MFVNYVYFTLRITDRVSVMLLTNARALYFTLERVKTPYIGYVF